MLAVTYCLVKGMHWCSWLQMLRSCLSNGISEGLPQIQGRVSDLNGLLGDPLS